MTPVGADRIIDHGLVIPNLGLADVAEGEGQISGIEQGDIPQEPLNARLRTAGHRGGQVDGGPNIDGGIGRQGRVDHNIRVAQEKSRDRTGGDPDDVGGHDVERTGVAFGGDQRKDGVGGARHLHVARNAAAIVPLIGDGGRARGERGEVGRGIHHGNDIGGLVGRRRHEGRRLGDDGDLGGAAGDLPVAVGGHQGVGSGVAQGREGDGIEGVGGIEQGVGAGVAGVALIPLIGQRRGPHHLSHDRIGRAEGHSQVLWLHGHGRGIDHEGLRHPQRFQTKGRPDGGPIIGVENRGDAVRGTEEFSDIDHHCAIQTRSDALPVEHVAEPVVAGAEHHLVVGQTKGVAVTGETARAVGAGEAVGAGQFEQGPAIGVGGGGSPTDRGAFDAVKIVRVQSSQGIGGDLIGQESVDAVPERDIGAEDVRCRAGVGRKAAVLDDEAGPRVSGHSQSHLGWNAVGDIFEQTAVLVRGV